MSESLHAIRPTVTVTLSWMVKVPPLNVAWPSLISPSEVKPRFANARLPLAPSSLRPSAPFTASAHPVGVFADVIRLNSTVTGSRSILIGPGISIPPNVTSPVTAIRSPGVTVPPVTFPNCSRFACLFWM